MFFGVKPVTLLVQFVYVWFDPIARVIQMAISRQKLSKMAMTAAALLNLWFYSKKE